MPLEAAVMVACPVCKEPVRRSVPARVAPFIRERCGVGIQAEAEARTWFCASCEHVFLTPNLTPEQLDRLYTDYRQETYTAERIRSEPDYKQVAREFDDPTSPTNMQRREFYDTYCFERFGQDGIVVDAGKYDRLHVCYAFPHTNVQSLPSFGRSDAPPIDTVLLASADVLSCTHALQSLPRPREFLAPLASGLREGAAVWIEVAIQYPGSLRAQFEMKELRFMQGAPRYGLLQTLHETMGHFSIRSLRRLLESLDLPPAEFVRSSIGILGVLCYKRSAGEASRP